MLGIISIGAESKKCNFGGPDERTSYERIMSNASVNIVTWVKEGNFHFPTENFDNPELDKEYYNQVMGFLEKNFPGKQK